jgi:hypothetical protein
MITKSDDLKSVLIFLIPLTVIILFFAKKKLKNIDITYAAI